jgi:hypothetical protein
MMAREGLGAIEVYSAASSVSQVPYLVDLRTLRGAYLVDPAKLDPTLFVQYFNHVPHARRRARVVAVRWAGSQDMSASVQLLRDHGLAGGHLGLVGALRWQQ